MEKVKIHAQDRKELAHKIGELVGVAAVYAGAGGNTVEGERFRFSYVVMNITLAQDCTIIWDERTAAETMNKVFDGLADAGYEFERPTLDTPADADGSDGSETADEPEWRDNCDREQPHEDWENCAEDFREMDELPPTRRGIADTEPEPKTKPDKRSLPRLYTLKTPRGEIFIAEEFETHDVAAAEGYGEYFQTALGTVYSYGDNSTFALVTSRKAGDWDTTTIGRDFRSIAVATEDADRLTIEVPLNGFTPEKLDNLTKMVSAKESLLKAALGVEELPIQTGEDTIKFPWFGGNLNADHTQAYSTLVSLLCKTAKEKKRITAKEKCIEGSPKYAMRCFLLALGFIGDEYKTARKILLSKLEGSGAFKYSKGEAVENE